MARYRSREDEETALGGKAKQYLYPSEVVTFVSCEAVPLLHHGTATRQPLT